MPGCRSMLLSLLCLLPAHSAGLTWTLNITLNSNIHFPHVFLPSQFASFLTGTPGHFLSKFSSCYGTLALEKLAIFVLLQTSSAPFVSLFVHLITGSQHFRVLLTRQWITLRKRITLVSISTNVMLPLCGFSLSGGGTDWELSHHKIL